MHEKNCSVDRIILGGVGPLWDVMSNIVQKLNPCPSIDQLRRGQKWFGHRSKDKIQYWKDIQTGPKPIWTTQSATNFDVFMKAENRVDWQKYTPIPNLQAILFFKKLHNAKCL